MGVVRMFGYCHVCGARRRLRHRKGSPMVSLVCERGQYSHPLRRLTVQEVRERVAMGVQS